LDVNTRLLHGRDSGSSVRSMLWVCYGDLLDRRIEQRLHSEPLDIQRRIVARPDDEPAHGILEFAAPYGQTILFQFERIFHIRRHEHIEWSVVGDLRVEVSGRTV